MIQGTTTILMGDRLSAMLSSLANYSPKGEIVALVADEHDLKKVMESAATRDLLSALSVKVSVIGDSPWTDQKMKNTVTCSPELLAGDTVIHTFFDQPEKWTPWMDQWTRAYRSYLLVEGMKKNPSAWVNTDDRFLGFKNTLKNLKVLLTHPDPRHLVASAEKRPVIVVGAGPSADEVLADLSEFADRALWISSDTMVKPLLKRGIQPHFITAMERDGEIISLLRNIQISSSASLVASVVCPPEIFKNFPSHINPVLGPYDTNAWLGFKKMQIDYGHSCVGLGLALGLQITSGPIALCGVDLAFSPSGEDHIEDVPYQQEEFYLKQKEAMRKEVIESPQEDGRTLQTYAIWNLFRSEFSNLIQKTPTSKVYNLSPWGQDVGGSRRISSGDFKKYLIPQNVVSFASPVFRTEEALLEIDRFINLAHHAVKENIRNPAQISSSIHFKNLYYPLFKGAMADASKKDLWWEKRKELLDCLSFAADELKQLKDDAKQNRLCLY